MDFNEYQRLAHMTLLNKEKNITRLAYFALGLAGESGEVAEKVKKIIRDSNEELTEEHKKQLQAELGDVLWYLSQFAWFLDIKFEDIAQSNIAKLHSRLERGALHGDGDNR